MSRSALAAPATRKVRGPIDGAPDFVSRIQNAYPYFIVRSLASLDAA